MTTTTVVTAGVLTTEVQSVTVDATGGTFPITFPAVDTVHAGGTIAAVAFDISAEDFTTAAEAIVGEGNIVVTGGPGDSGGNTPYILTYAGDLALQNVPVVTIGTDALTGGAGTAVAATTTPGISRARLDGSGGAAGRGGSSVLLRNTGAVTAYIGGSDVTTSNGFPLAATTTMPCPLTLTPADQLYACTASSTAAIAVIETGA